jgi:FSR family fosmidomycin resistance protein-like MFS transporter
MSQTTLAAVAHPPARRTLTALGIPAAVWVLAIAHGLVDCYALFVQPLWPSLATYVGTDESRIQWSYMAWSLAGSITQLGFARLADKGYGRKLLWLGPLVGFVLVGTLGGMSGLASVTMVLVLSNLGFAAFHPEAATLAGAAAPADRARAMSIFAVGGYLGQAIGPPLSGYLVSHGGLTQLAWTIVPGLALCTVLIIALKLCTPAQPEHPATAPSNPHAHTPAPSMRAVLKGREVQVLYLVTLSVLRVAAAMGVPLALAYGLADRGANAEVIGFNQSVFLVGMGAGTLACAVLVNKRNEQAVIWLAPLAVALLMPVANLLGTAWLWPLMALLGPLLGLSLPILTSRGQELLPEAPRVGSSLTMGVTWGLGGILVAALMAAVNYLGDHFLAFYVLALWAAMSAAMTWPGWAFRRGGQTS